MIANEPHCKRVICDGGRLVIFNHAVCWQPPLAYCFGVFYGLFAATSSGSSCRPPVRGISCHPGTAKANKLNQ